MVFTCRHLHTNINVRCLQVCLKKEPSYKRVQACKAGVGQAHERAIFKNPSTCFFCKTAVTFLNLARRCLTTDLHAGSLVVA